MDPVFRALADPSRRAILDLLVEGRRSVGELLAHFRFSQPALSQHLRVLREAGLVSARREGRQQRYRLEGEGLRSVADWLRTYERFWQGRLDALGEVLDDEAQKKGRTTAQRPRRGKGRRS
jgi:DNA-binding transcriptional ArsR family regulator